EQDALQGSVVLGPRRDVMGSLLGQSPLHGLKQLAVDQWRLRARADLTFIENLADVEAIAPSGSSIALVRRRSPPPPQPHLGHAAGGAESRGRGAPGTVTVPLCSRPNASPFWIMLLLVWGRLDHRMIRLRGGDSSSFEAIGNRHAPTCAAPW